LRSGGLAVADHVCHSHLLGSRSSITNVSKLALNVVEAVLELVLAALRFLETSHQILFRIATHLLTTPGITLVLLQLRDPPAEELIDDFEFADASLQGGILSDKLLICLWLAIESV
jgi:hypothetical protein